MRTLRPPFLALVLLAASCTPPVQDEVIDIVYDPCEPLVFDVLYAKEEAQLTEVARGLALWNELIGAQLTFEHEGELADGLLSLRDDERTRAARVPLEFDRAAPAFRGLYDDEYGVVYINDRLTGRDLAITVAHELGHVFGLFHIAAEQRPSVMNHGNLEHAPNDADAEAVAELWGACPPAGAG